MTIAHLLRPRLFRRMTWFRWMAQFRRTARFQQMLWLGRRWGWVNWCVLLGSVAYLSAACHWQTNASVVSESGRSAQSPIAASAPTPAVPNGGMASGDLANQPTRPPVSRAPAIQPPLSTRGAQIVDARGQVVLLRGVNWFGMETELQVPHGLWKRDYQEMLAQIKGLGYNVIRLPYSVQALRGTSISGVDFKIGSNGDFEGKSPLVVMDWVVQEAQRQGLMILLDSHRLNNQRIPELWYGDGFTEADWIDTWKLLAKRYRNQPNVIGADLKNEPHGRASWGTGDRATDWRLAAERAGNAVLAVNPDWLIVVEGVEKNVPGQKLKVHWQGGNLEGVARFPVRLNNQRKLVYSPHEYGPGVFQQAWFQDKAFPQNLRDRWEIGWNYIATRNIAPIYIGEFGGRQVDQTSPEGIWQRQLVQFINNQKLSFTYWSWNPNSDDTGGILQDDWQTIDQPKQTLLNSLLSVSSLRPRNPLPVMTGPASTQSRAPMTAQPRPPLRASRPGEAANSP
jgi:endoglucanase